MGSAAKSVEDLGKSVAPTLLDPVNGGMAQGGKAVKDAIPQMPSASQAATGVPPLPTPPPPPAPIPAASQPQRDQASLAAKRNAGSASTTVATSPLGIPGAAYTTSKTLLGQ